MNTDAISGMRLVERRRNQRGEVTWWKIEVYHRGLNEVKTVGDRELEVAERKAEALHSKLQEKWLRLELQEGMKKQRRESKGTAEASTTAALADLESLRTILLAGISHPAQVDWAGLENHKEFQFTDTGNFPLVEFSATGEPIAAKSLPTPPQPNSAESKYKPTLTLIDYLWSPLRQKKEAQAKSSYDRDMAAWQSAMAKAGQEQAIANQMLVDAKASFSEKKAVFEGKQATYNAKLAKYKAAYLAGEERAVARYNETLLGGSKYPDSLDIEFSAGFNSSNGIAVVECELPDKSQLPTLQKVTFVASTNEVKEKHISESDRDKLYDSVLYQVALRTCYEVFHADQANVVKVVVFNGWVNALNPATGQHNHGCILSLQVSKGEIDAVDLRKVDPRACFRQFKGISAAKLSGMTPVRPILQLDNDDPRFVAAHGVADRIQDGYNLATMDWEDFEHLVRELFANEFGRDGAEVHVTRASSDGGVDAVVLDPDPIRGGKIVIQAKRYTNTVGLSAVRDLYRTVINEGANRGILVSTADYGSDSYEFVKGKPLSLLNGGNLLALLEKHGHKARIDLREAKIINAQNKENTEKGGA